MSSFAKNLNWRICYAVFCLIYAAWMVYLGLDNFEKVHSEYRWARARVQPARIEEIALHEIVDQCRRESRRELKRIDRYRESVDISTPAAEDPCFSWPKAVLEERQKAVAERLMVEKNRLKRKLVVFNVSFGIFFLILPLVLLYLLFSFLVWLFRDLKFVKK